MLQFGPKGVDHSRIGHHSFKDGAGPVRTPCSSGSAPAARWRGRSCVLTKTLASSDQLPARRVQHRRAAHRGGQLAAECDPIVGIAAPQRSPQQRMHAVVCTRAQELIGPDATGPCVDDWTQPTLGAKGAKRGLAIAEPQGVGTICFRPLTWGLVRSLALPALRISVTRTSSKAASTIRSPSAETVCSRHIGSVRKAALLPVAGATRRSRRYAAMRSARLCEGCDLLLLHENSAMSGHVGLLLNRIDRRQIRTNEPFQHGAAGPCHLDRGTHLVRGGPDVAARADCEGSSESNLLPRTGSQGQDRCRMGRLPVSKYTLCFPKCLQHDVILLT